MGIKRDLKKLAKRKKTKIVVTFNLIEVIIITLITAIIVSICSGILVFKNYDEINKNYNTSPATLNEFITTYEHILSSYVEQIDQKELVSAAIEGMFSYLEDKNTNYINQTDTKDLMEKLDGEYKGIGISMIDQDGNIVIAQVFDNSPASSVGLQANDIIISINGESMEEKDASYISEILKGKDTKVVMVVKRGSETFTYTMDTEVVDIPSITSKVIDGYGYIYIETFSATTAKQFEEHLKELEKNEISGLIIDVRYNSGGYLSGAFDISQLFVKKGKIIYQLKDKNSKIESKVSKLSSDREYPIVLLVNEGSASASEVLAAALRDSYGAKLVGVKTYGKGTIQETKNLSSGAMVKYTTNYWLTPNGECIDNIGLYPEVEIPLTSEDTSDVQLQKALEYIKGM